MKRHGKWGSPEYLSWSGMIQRCTNRKNNAYRNYGGRGIKVCNRWRSFKNFFDDMGHRPTSYTLERINNSMGYEPLNVKWASPKEQSLNTSRNRIIRWNGKCKPLGVWAIKFNIPRSLLEARLNRGWPTGKALRTKKIDRSKIMTINGVSMTITDWAKIHGQNPVTVFSRIRRGWPMRKAILGTTKREGKNQNNFSENSAGHLQPKK